MNTHRVPALLLATLAFVGLSCSSNSSSSSPTTDVPASSTTAIETTTTRPATTADLAVLTYNVAGLPAELSGSEPDVNTEIIGPLLNDYDLVLLQESWLTPDPNPVGLRTYHEILIEASTHEFASAPLPAPLGDDPRRPTALLSDGLNRFADVAFDPEMTRRMWTTCGEASADCLSLKGFSMARTTIADGLTVDVYNLHMDAGSEDAPIRGDNVAELIAFIVSESEGRAVIVGGDFNLHLDRDPDADQFAELLSSTGLVDVCTELACSEPNRIDRILVRSSDDVTITATEWSNDAGTFTRADGEPLSDHDPVAVALTVTAS